MNTKKHSDHPHIAGEHRWGDKGQLTFLFLFLVIWITDSFIIHYSTFLIDTISDYVRIPVAGIILVAGWYLARRGLKAVFGIKRNAPGIIRTGVFGIVRHPIYTGAILFYLGSSAISMSIASAAFCIPIIIFYVFIAKYEERILTEEFGEDYLDYKQKVGMLFPKFGHRGS